jgi:hypothetical protein
MPREAQQGGAEARAQRWEGRGCQCGWMSLRHDGLIFLFEAWAGATRLGVGCRLVRGDHRLRVLPGGVSSDSGYWTPTSYPCVRVTQHKVTYSVRSRTGRAGGSTYRTVGGPTKGDNERAPLFRKQQR